MPTLDELRRKNARLKAEREVMNEFDRRNMERKRLERENSELEHAKRNKVLREVSHGIRSGGMATLRFLDNLTKPQVKHSKIINS